MRHGGTQRLATVGSCYPLGLKGKGEEIKRAQDNYALEEECWRDLPFQRWEVKVESEEGRHTLASLLPCSDRTLTIVSASRWSTTKATWVIRSAEPEQGSKCGEMHGLGQNSINRD